MSTPGRGSLATSGRTFAVDGASAPMPTRWMVVTLQPSLDISRLRVRERARCTAASRSWPARFCSRRFAEAVGQAKRRALAAAGSRLRTVVKGRRVLSARRRGFLKSGEPMKEAYAVRRTVPPSAEIRVEIDKLLGRGMVDDPQKMLSELGRLGAGLGCDPGGECRGNDDNLEFGISRLRLSTNRKASWTSESSERDTSAGR
jgi:hypothetical protein